jgi:hypothetical protein
VTGGWGHKGGTLLAELQVGSSVTGKATWRLENFSGHDFFFWLRPYISKRVQNHHAIWFLEVNHGFKGLVFKKGFEN